MQTFIFACVNGAVYRQTANSEQEARAHVVKTYNVAIDGLRTDKMRRAQRNVTSNTERGF